jgi:putative hydroxymethylpyrimidine transport system substrate-binding protein
VLLDWFPNPDHASLYLAQSEGDFTSAGLQGVTLQAPSGSQDALKLVSTGAMPLGISYEPNVVTAASQGLDVEAVAALVPTPLNTLLISSQSGIKTIKGLAGKKIGTNGDPVETATLNTILKRNGVNPSSTQQIAVSEGLIPAMLSGNVQAIISGYRNVEEIQLKLKGQPPVAFNVENEGMPTYDELVIVAQKSKLASDPGYAAMVRDFLAGLAKGDAAAQASSSAAIAALKPVVGAGGYTDADINAMVPVTVADYKNPLGFGEMSTAKWQAYANWMLANKLITKAVTASDAETDAYLPGKG